MPQRRNFILASHLVFHGYGHWLANDPRGSGSTSVRKDQLRDLGDIHPGRKRIQPPRDELRNFYREANEKLDHEPLWFRSPEIRMVGEAFGAAAQKCGYTVWACAICSNHAHAVVRTHRDRSEVIWYNLAAAARNALHDARSVASNHPVWSHRPYKVFLHSVDEVRDRIQYVEENPLKEKLPRQVWSFVRPYSP